MVVIGGNIWCGTANTIKILNPATKEVEDVVTVGQEESKVSPWISRHYLLYYPQYLHR